MKKSTKVFIDMNLEIRKIELQKQLENPNISDFDRKIKQNALRATIEAQKEFQEEMWPNRLFPEGDEQYEYPSTY